MTELRGKVAIITGGGSGIGRGVAIALAGAGVRVVVCGRREGKLEDTLRLIREKGGDGSAVAADVSVEADVDRLVAATLDGYGQIDFLVNNAGIAINSSLHQASPQEWDRLMATNLRGPFLTMRAVLPHMRRRKSGHIVNISSESALNYYRGDGIYGTSKHALNDLGEYVQRENQDFNIRVDTVCPGMVVTEMTQDEPNLDQSKCLYPEDIADLVLFLLTRRQNVKIGTPILIQTMLNPWE